MLGPELNLVIDTVGGETQRRSFRQLSTRDESQRFPEPGIYIEDNLSAAMLSLRGGRLVR